MKSPRTNVLGAALATLMVSGVGAMASTASVVGVQWQVMKAAGMSPRTSGGAVTVTPATSPLLKNAGSYITVRTTHKAEDGCGAAVERNASPYTGRMIEVPQNARAGDPAYAGVLENEYFEEEGRWDDGTYERKYGIAFAEGVNLGYTTLHRHGRPVRQPIHRRDRDLPEFGSTDPHRQAVLRFGEAAQPRLDGLDDGFRRAQRSFHRATLTPGVRREADGLRHERTGPRPERGTHGRTRW